MRMPYDEKKRLGRHGAVIAIVIALVAVALFGIYLWETNNGKFPLLDFDDDIVEYYGKEYEPKKNIETFLVMGLDKVAEDIVSNSYNNDQQSDFLMLFVFDKDEEKCMALQINRDTMADVNLLNVAGNKYDTITSQIALSHTYGKGGEVSCRNTADSVSSLLLGAKIDHFISLTMDAVPALTELVGGVELEILDDFSGIDDTLVKGEVVNLMGEHALHYVRTRRGLDDSTNNTRMKRQKQFIDALYEKFMECVETDDEFIIDASLAMSDFVVSDRSVTQIQELSRKFKEYEFIRVEDIEGETLQGKKFMEFYPDEESVFKTVIGLFYTPVEK